MCWILFWTTIPVCKIQWKCNGLNKYLRLLYMLHCQFWFRIRPKISPKRQYVLICWLVQLSSNRVSFLSMSTHQLPSLSLGGKQLVLYWSVSVLLPKAFCQKLVLSNHTIHLSHGFRLQPVINKQTNYKSKLTSGSLGSGYIWSRKKQHYVYSSGAQHSA